MEFYYLNFAMLLLKMIDQSFDYYEQKYLLKNHHLQYLFLNLYIRLHLL